MKKKCTNCDESDVLIPLNQFPLHTMKHVVTDQQLRINLPDIAPNSNVKTLILCFLCGKKSASGCRLKCIAKPGSKTVFIISTSCMEGKEIHGQFYTRLFNPTKTNPYSNAPVMCPLCCITHWRWNMQQHYAITHPDIDCLSTLIVSKFEEKCVEFFNFKGNIKKKDFDNLYSSYKSECENLFKKRIEKLKKKIIDKESNVDADNDIDLQHQQIENHDNSDDDDLIVRRNRNNSNHNRRIIDDSDSD
eukprot:8805_1